MAIGPWVGGRIFDSYGSYAWMFIGSAAIGAGAVAIALTFRPPRTVTARLQPA
jgi:cyanate permease